MHESSIEEPAPDNSKCEDKQPLSTIHEYNQQSSTQECNQDSTVYEYNQEPDAHELTQPESTIHSFTQYDSAQLEQVDTSAYTLPNEEEEPSLKQKIIAGLKERWFLISVFVSILVAFAFPWLGKKGGPLHPERTTKFAIGIIFFFSGFTMKARVMLKALMQWRLHIFIQVFCFLVFPTCTFALSKLLSVFHFNQWLAQGFLILGCVPTTISSTQAEGNEAAALFNSALSNSIGVIVSPAVLYLFNSGADIFSKVPIASVFLNLFETVIFPLAVGQGINIFSFIFFLTYFLIFLISKRMLNMKLFKREGTVEYKIAGFAGSILLLFIVYTIFSDAFLANINITTNAILVTLGIVILLMFATTALAFVLTLPKFWKFSRPDRIAAMFCGPQKTLSVGIALMGTIYGDDPNLVLVSEFF